MIYTHIFYWYESVSIWQVDNGVIEHLLPSLYKEDWDVLIAHFLGVVSRNNCVMISSPPNFKIKLPACRLYRWMNMQNLLNFYTCIWLFVSFCPFIITWFSACLVNNISYNHIVNLFNRRLSQIFNSVSVASW